MSKPETAPAVVTDVKLAERHFSVGSAEGGTVDYSVGRDLGRVNQLIAAQSAARKETVKALNDVLKAIAAGVVAGGAIAAIWRTEKPLR